MGILGKGQALFSRIKIQTLNEGIKRFTPLILAGAVGYAAADLTILHLRPSMLPSEAPPVRAAPPSQFLAKDYSEYGTIVSRNIFNPDGKIPPALSADEEGSPVEQEAVLSQLPLTLQGTIVHFNPARSIATIKINAKNVTQSFIPEEEVEGLARITKVERRRVTFQNLNNRRLEYIEIPESAAFNFDLKGGGEKAAVGPIEETGRNSFAIKKDEVERLTANMSQVLQQARMEPRFGPGNQVEAFCFVSIQTDTIYEKLGFRVGDCITSVNGKAVTSPQEAMNLYNSLRTSNNIQLGIDRDGRSENFNYDIK
jgi:general secretion pathway protein C